jgi:hypothetical protein
MYILLQKPFMTKLMQNYTNLCQIWGAHGGD